MPLENIHKLRESLETEEEMNPAEEEASPSNTKVSVSVIGDVFIDLFCYLDSNDYPVLGGDVRIEKPMTPVPGGSGLNTATHLQALIQNFSNDDGNQEEMDVTLQTSYNEADDYGRLLVTHAEKSGFQIVNCVKPSAQDKEENGSKSTGHCMVVVSQGERSFLTHLGVMASFKASHTILHELVHCRTALPYITNHHHHLHIAGYFNLPGFWDGNLMRRLKLVRERRRQSSHGDNVFTTTTSLVPQYDATEQWDGQILELLPFIDFFILNSLEAGHITKIPIDDEEGDGALERVVTFLQLARFFNEESPYTYVIITMGKKGAVVLYGGKVLASIDAPVPVDKPLDPTGAGDAFAAGFLKGVMEWREQKDHEECPEIGAYNYQEGAWNDAVLEGLKWGCALGTSCVLKAGASTPSSKEEIEKMMCMKEKVKEEDMKQNEEDMRQATEKNLIDEDIDSESDGYSGSGSESYYSDEEGSYYSDEESSRDTKVHEA